ncbi:glycosyltransferase [Pseudopontixanthobacter vadosimaris]|uniref:glycosyltransferase n=1 Tax=Pseudopontixanthobacter vadosimaris TaxID=2726450 RepID=UPI0014740F3C|nr:glycosyltransferase [Pseudopontixanthobacter vadosimaris]
MRAQEEKWLFVHDHRFVRTGDFVGSQTGFGTKLWDRYLRFCNELTVIGREGAPANKSVLLQSSRDNVRFRLVPDHGRSLKRLVKAREQAAILREEIANHQVVIARIPSVLGLQAIEIARSMGKTVAVEVVGCAWSSLWDYGSRAGKVFAPIQWIQMRRAVWRADHVIYVTNRFLQKRYPTSARHVASASNVQVPAAQAGPDGLEIDPSILERRLARIETCGDGTEPVRLGLIGSLHVRSKGVQFVLQALTTLRKKGRPITFHVLGGGDRQPWIAEAESLGVGDLVTFDGTLPEGEAVFDWLDDIDIYLQPSLQEGLPRALIEALSRACPAIGSNCAGIPELLDDTMIVPMRDVPALESAIARLKEDKDLMAEQARKNFATAHDYLAPKLQARRDAFYSRVRNAASSI